MIRYVSLQGWPIGSGPQVPVTVYSILKPNQFWPFSSLFLNQYSPRYCFLVSGQPALVSGNQYSARSIVIAYRRAKSASMGLKFRLRQYLEGTCIICRYNIVLIKVKISLKFDRNWSTDVRRRCQDRATAPCRVCASITTFFSLR